MNSRKKNLILLCSYPKSGNTWLRILLSNVYSESFSSVDINSLITTPIASSRNLFEDYTATSSTELTENEINNLKPDVYRKFSESSSNSIFLKVHDAWQINKKNEPIFPPDVIKGVIYLIRNPYDVAISYSNHNSISIDEVISRMNNPDSKISPSDAKGSRQLLQNLYSWTEHVRSWIDYSDLPVLTIRYEDLLNDTYKYFKLILDFLGIHRSDPVIKKAIRNSDFEEVSRQEKLHGFKEKPIKAEQFFSHGKASNVIDIVQTDHYKKLLSKHQDIMKKFGYDNCKKEI